MATKQDLSRLCLFTDVKNSFTRRELKDNFNFSEGDFSLLKRKGFILETGPKIYSVQTWFIEKNFRTEFENELRDSISKSEFLKALSVLGKLFSLQDTERTFQYNFILFLISQAVDIGEPWCHIVRNLVLEDIRAESKSPLENLSRELAFRGEFVESLSVLHRIQKEPRVLDFYDDLAIMLMAAVLNRRMNEKMALFECIQNNDIERLNSMLSHFSTKRHLGEHEKVTQIYGQVLAATQRFGVKPRKFKTDFTTERELIFVGDFDKIAEMKRKELKFKRTLKNPNIAEMLLVRLRRIASDKKKGPLEMCVVPMCALYELVTHLEREDYESASTSLERFLGRLGIENRKSSLLETVLGSCKNGDYGEACRLFDSLYLSHIASATKAEMYVI